MLWRKNAFGCHSEAGCRFVARILTVVQTLRLQKRPILPFLYDSLSAHRAGHPHQSYFQGSERLPFLFERSIAVIPGRSQIFEHLYAASGCSERLPSTEKLKLSPEGQ